MLKTCISFLKNRKPNNLKGENMAKSIEKKFNDAQCQLKEFVELYNAICFLPPQGEGAKDSVIREIVDKGSKLKDCVKVIMDKMIQKVGEKK